MGAATTTIAAAIVVASAVVEVVPTTAIPIAAMAKVTSTIAVERSETAVMEASAPAKTPVVVEHNAVVENRSAWAKAAEARLMEPHHTHSFHRTEPSESVEAKATIEVEGPVIHRM